MEHLQTKQKNFLSIVMPAYNESEIISKVIADLSEKVLDNFEQSEFIIVNDCSTDNTLEMLYKSQEKYPNLRIITNEKNSGHGASLLRGLTEAKGDYIMQNDSDDQFFAEDFWILFERLQKSHFDMVIGHRKERHDAFHRKLISFFERIAIFLLFRLYIKDGNSPFRIYKKNTMDKILPKVKVLNPFFPSILLALCAKKIGLRVGEISVRHKTRKTGTTFIRSFKIIKLCGAAIKELFIFKQLLKTIK